MTGFSRLLRHGSRIVPAALDEGADRPVRSSNVSTPGARSALVAPVRSNGAAVFASLQVRPGHRVRGAGLAAKQASFDFQAPPAVGSFSWLSDGIGMALPPRTALLHAYQAAEKRPLDPQKAIDAIRLRHFAASWYPKQVSSRLLRHVPLTRSHRAARQLEKLKSMPVPDIIRQIESGILVSNRSILTDVATEHLTASMNFDREAYKEGLHRMARWEGVHSTAGRGITFAASGFAFGLAPVVAGIGTAVAHGFARAIKLAGHHLPTAVFNPIVTGLLRIDTDICKSVTGGGISVLAKNVENAAPLATIRADMRSTTVQLQRQMQDYRLRPERSALRTAFHASWAAQESYKAHLGGSKSQTWSKGCGMGVNAMAAAAQAGGIAFPAAVPASLAVQALCVPLQWGAGYLDLHTGQAYQFRASLKYGALLTPEAADLAADKLEARHIDSTRLRSLFASHESQQVALIREVAMDELGELRHAQVKLTRQQARAAQGRLPARGAQVVRQHAVQTRLAALERRIGVSENQLRQFETLRAAEWESLPKDGTIGRCLDDPRILRRLGRAARKRKPGEVVVQIWQRYKQTYGDGLLSPGVVLPVVDIGLHAGSIPHFAASAMPSFAEALPSDVAVVVAGIGFTAATGVVRAAKAEDKRDLAASVAPAGGNGNPERDALQKQWAVRLDGDGNTIDLSHTGGFDRTLHTRAQRVWRFVRIIPRGFFSVERALYQTLRARHARRRAIGVLREAAELLEAGAVGGERATVFALREAVIKVG